NGIPLLLSLILATNAGYLPYYGQAPHALRVVRPNVLVPEPPSAPIPYSFSYTADATGGSSSRSESGDGFGAVKGSYSMTGADWQRRIVQYTADASGFKPQISTNEIGTDPSKSPADTTIDSLPGEVQAPAVPSLVKLFKPFPRVYHHPFPHGYHDYRYSW
ncbi:adult-specific rigid cuticular protein 15.7-like, partial [Limulus polyphemus]|uniref:Adult-specific rigid cuticular protein 15.7-like n=1 Tax=Limulus polyphemus TaxID=6850 RepID=A0ABM1BYB9_LIMPO